MLHYLLKAHSFQSGIVILWLQAFLFCFSLYTSSIVRPYFNSVSEHVCCIPYHEHMSNELCLVSAISVPLSGFSSFRDCEWKCRGHAVPCEPRWKIFYMISLYIAQLKSVVHKAATATTVPMPLYVKRIHKHFTIHPPPHNSIIGSMKEERSTCLW